MLNKLNDVIINVIIIIQLLVMAIIISDAPHVNPIMIIVFFMPNFCSIFCELVNSIIDVALNIEAINP